MPDPIYLSLVIPAFNEQETIPTLLQRADAALAPLNKPFEIIIVDDGSTDATPQLLKDALPTYPALRVLRMQRNSGQSAAFAAGFAAAAGSLIATIDADLQNDPAEIPRLAAMLEAQNVDMVTGWRKDRHDTPFRRFQTKFANRIRNRISRETINDSASSLKIYRAHCVKGLYIFNGAHRFFPTLVKMRGYSCLETPVAHSHRFAGQPKYGLRNRAWRAFIDLLGVRWMKNRTINVRADEVQRYNAAMRLLITADLHFNHRRSQPSAIDLIARINQTPADAILVIGDVAPLDGDALEQCLRLFTHTGPKLFVPGNHELWTNTADSLVALTEQLPRRIANLGWHWLPGNPFRAGRSAIVGNIGWYDYSFAPRGLDIPRRFFEAKLTPGAARALGCDDLLAGDDIPAESLEMVARWNDGTRVKLGMSDEAFLDRCLTELDRDLTTVADAAEVLVAIHHVPDRVLLPPHPPPTLGPRAFAGAFLGSDKIAQTVLRHPNVRHIYCGHTHVPARATLGPDQNVQAINIGSGYTRKCFLSVDLPD